MENQVLERRVLNYYKITVRPKNIVWINSLEDYIKIFLNDYVYEAVCNTNKRKPIEYVFRGLSSSEQKYSKITNIHYKKRNGKPSLSQNSYVNALNKELIYIRRFQQNAPPAVVSNNSALDLVAMAQHNSLRTRLIDWTRSPLIATLFVLHSTPQEKSSNGRWQHYYLILAANCKEHIVAQGLPTQAKLESLKQTENYLIYGEMLKYLTEAYESEEYEIKKHYFEELLSSTNTKFMLNEAGAKLSNFRNESTVNKLVDYFKKDRMFFLETNYSNTRIAAQRGLFQISVNPYKEYIDNGYSNIDLIFIRDKARDAIIEYCEKLGMNNYALMPDMQSVALEINRKMDEELNKSKS